MPEYRVIDPNAMTLTQFLLPDGGDRYPDGQTFSPGDHVKSRALEGVIVDVATKFAEAEAEAN